MEAAEAVVAERLHEEKIVFFCDRTTFQGLASPSFLYSLYLQLSLSFSFEGGEWGERKKIRGRKNDEARDFFLL